MTAKNLKLLVTLFRTEGLREVLHRLSFRFLHIHTFSVFRLRRSDPLRPGQAPAGIDIAEVSRERLGQLRAGRTDLPEYFYRDESDDAAERCWVGLEEGRLVFITWVSRQNSSGMVRIGTNEAELNYFYCLPHLRGRHVTRNAILIIARDLFAEGIDAVYTVVFSGNLSMIRSISSCGFGNVGSIKRFGLITWPRTPVAYPATGAGRTA
jgi:RimJ/RimL family protein N-acetyltransferase